MAPHVHRSHRSGWLRAAVLGANDGVVSISSLVLGVAAAQTESHGILVAGVAGLVAGVLSMAAGEYVSVSSQADTEHADLEVERQALASEPGQEHAELAGIYIRRGLDPDLARRVAGQLMAHDALDAHARDEIGISTTLSARPLQAAFTSAISFAIGGIIPLVAALVLRGPALIPGVAAVSLVLLALLGAMAARAGGAPVVAGALRVLVWGALAMAVTGVVGSVFGVT
ncbi:MAG: VIT family protein [Casimicrobiaceae bacterium]|nr:VIT family protein [Pseudomonadota bacterium]